MSAVRWIESQGVRVQCEGDSLILEGLDEIRPELASEVLAFARQNKAQLLAELGGAASIPWPPPESGVLVVRSVPWQYALLHALAAMYGAGLTKSTGGGLTLNCPATMPQAASQAARDHLAELASYIEGRLP